MLRAAAGPSGKRPPARRSAARLANVATPVRGSISSAAVGSMSSMASSHARSALAAASISGRSLASSSEGNPGRWSARVVVLAVVGALVLVGALALFLVAQAAERRIGLVQRAGRLLARLLRVPVLAQLLHVAADGVARGLEMVGLALQPVRLLLVCLVAHVPLVLGLVRSRRPARPPRAPPRLAARASRAGTRPSSRGGRAARCRPPARPPRRAASPPSRGGAGRAGAPLWSGPPRRPTPPGCLPSRAWRRAA